MVWYFPEIRWLYIGTWKQPVFQITAYLAALTAAFITIHYLRKEGEKDKDIIMACAAALIGVMFGSRLFFFFGPWTWNREWALWERAYRMIQFWGDGLVLWGGVLFCILAIYIFCAWRKRPLGTYMDAMGVGFPITLFIARLGCMLANDHPEKTTSLAIGYIRYSSTDILPFGLSSGAATWTSTKTVYPAIFLYEIALLMIAIITLFLYAQRAKTGLFKGSVLVFALLAYAVQRFFNEFLRTYSWHFLGMTASQIISLLVIAGCVWAIYRNAETIGSYLRKLTHAFIAKR